MTSLKDRLLGSSEGVTGLFGFQTNGRHKKGSLHKVSNLPFNRNSKESPLLSQELLLYISIILHMLAFDIWMSNLNVLKPRNLQISSFDVSHAGAQTPLNTARWSLPLIKAILMGSQV